MQFINKIENSLVPFPKSQKININMEIKNLNIFGNNSAANITSKKKKLHKKTISCLPQQ